MQNKSASQFVGAAMAPAGLCNVPIKREIPNQIENLLAVICDLENKVNALAERTEPLVVIAQYEAKTQVDNSIPPRVVKCQIASQIESAVERIANVSSTISRRLDEIQI